MKIVSCQQTTTAILFVVKHYKKSGHDSLIILNTCTTRVKVDDKPSLKSGEKMILFGQVST